MPASRREMHCDHDSGTSHDLTETRGLGRNKGIAGNMGKTAFRVAFTVLRFSISIRSALLPPSADLHPVPANQAQTSEYVCVRLAPAESARQASLFPKGRSVCEKIALLHQKG